VTAPENWLLREFDEGEAMTELRDRADAGMASRGEQAKEKAQEAAGQAKNRFASEVDQRSTQAAETLRSTAGDVRSVGEELRKQGKDKPAQLADRAAEQVERVGGYLHGTDGDRILRDAEELGRRNPWAVAAGGLALGFVASRFLKASSARRFQAAGPSTAGTAPRHSTDPASPRGL
jgi:ElaB/YqjD/DUF883 family membrane-anchored ribosome-binding protein